MPADPGGHERGWWSPSVITPARLLSTRFTGLTIVLMIVLLSVSAINEKGLRDLVVGLGFSVLLLFAIRTVGRRLRILTLALAVPTFIGHWTLQLSNSLMLRATGFLLTSLFLAFLTMVILMAVLRDASITADTIVGAVCAYFLLGVTWGTAYALVALVSPGAFSVSPALATAAQWSAPSLPITPLMQYFSFITLSTVGFGDISPLSGGARTLTALEGITGQLYLAVLIARLVGMHTARSPQR